MDSFLDEHSPSEVAVISYQCSGSETVPGGMNRYLLYDGEGFPTVTGDGITDIWPCSLSDLNRNYTQRKAIDSPMTITVTEDAVGEFTAHISTTEAVDGTFMMVAFEDYQHAGQRYQRYARELLTTFRGEAFSLGAGDNTSITKSFSVQSGWNYDNMGVVAWVYADSQMEWNQHPSVQAATGFSGGSPPTPTPPPSATDTPAPTNTPVPTQSGSPTPTPDCTELGATLWMPSNVMAPGSPCACKVTVCNPGSETYPGTPLFAILSIAGDYFFAPTFGEFDHYTIDLTPGSQEITVLSEFPWPSGAGSFSGALWYAAMTNPGMSSLFGAMDTFEFSWTE
jgi:hypothetical protein